MSLAKAYTLLERLKLCSDDSYLIADAMRLIEHQQAVIEKYKDALEFPNVLLNGAK